MPAARHIIAACCLMAALPLAARAQQPFTLETARKIVGVGGVELSPDGKSVVVSVSRPSFDRDRNESELYVVDVATGVQRQLTYARHGVSAARFSPDGRTLAFLAADTSDQSQIWLLPMAGGEPRQLTSHPTGVEHYAWRPDGRAIAYAATDEAPTLEGEAKHLTALQVGAQDMFLREPVRPQHIWLIELDSTAGRRLTSGPWTLEFVLPPGSPPSGLSWSPDGGSIAFAAVVAPESGKLDSVHVEVLDVRTGALRSLTGARRFEDNPAFSPDGSSIAYWYPKEGRGDQLWQIEVWVAPAGGGPGRSVTYGLDRQLFSSRWLPGGKALLVAGNDRTTVGAWIQPLDGPARRLDLGDLVINGAFGYDITVASQRPVIAFTATTPTRPSELYVMDSPTARPRRLTSFNAWADSVSWGTMERVTWTSDQFKPDGVVTLPPGYARDRKHPLVLLIHGGPQSASRLSFSILAQLMAAEGWVVFSPNYRGSDNLGNAYMAAIIGDAGAGPGRDVMSGVAMLRKRSYVDPHQTAVTGWSYGGFMTSWLIGNYPDEWQAAMAGAPVTNWEDQYNFGDGSIAWRYFFGGSPWTDNRLQAYREQSPITYATRIRTPTLVMSNLEDFRVPPTQAFALYRAMKDNGVETEFVGFAGRAHFPGDPINLRDVIRRWVEWVKAHLPPAVATP